MGATSPNHTSGSYYKSPYIPLNRYLGPCGVGLTVFKEFRV